MGAELKAWLEESGTSCSAFARSIGVTDSAVWRWAHGERRPGLEQAVAIEEATKGRVKATSWLPRKRPSRRAA